MYACVCLCLRVSRLSLSLSLSLSNNAAATTTTGHNDSTQHSHKPRQTGCSQQSLCWRDECGSWTCDPQCRDHHHYHRRCCCCCHFAVHPCPRPFRSAVPGQAALTTHTTACSRDETARRCPVGGKTLPCACRPTAAWCERPTRGQDTKCCRQACRRRHTHTHTRAKRAM